MSRSILVALLNEDSQTTLVHLLEAAITDSGYKFMASRHDLPKEGDPLLLSNRIRSLLNGYDFAVTIAVGGDPEWLARSAQFVAAQRSSAAFFEPEGFACWKKRLKDPRASRRSPKLVCLIGEPDVFPEAQSAFSGAKLEFVPKGFENSSAQLEFVAQQIRITAGSARSAQLRGI